MQFNSAGNGTGGQRTKQGTFTKFIARECTVIKF